ncbi:transmembrane protein 209 [Anopheles bellator]|uniref:transmembrane protein 209 n=1 Tax=Anopheles bellator TaxID=139047 RepID=UPI00264A1F60|nr:transmembrane protein 209 [Anopheles bellator]
MLSRPGSPGQRSPIVSGTLTLNLNKKRSKEWLCWGTMNVLLLSVLLFDISNKCPYSFSRWYYIEYAAAAILACSMTYYYAQYFFYLFGTEPIKGTEQQRQMLQVASDDNSFITTPPQKKKPTSAEASPVTVSTSLLYSLNKSADHAVTPPPGWVNNRRTSSPPRQQQSPQDRNCSFETQTQNVTAGSGMFSTTLRKLAIPSDTIVDEQQLDSFLTKEGSLDKMSNSYKEHMNISDALMNSFYGRSQMYDMATLLKNSVYQLSSSVTPSKQLAKEHETGAYNAFMDGSPEGLKKVSTTQLSNYVGNLRMWISLTILQRIEEEVNLADQAFKSRGFADIQIGAIGLERLKKTAENQQLVSLYIPRLPLLIPFLEMSTNQEYLVQRIKDLSKGSCIADYRWNSGASYKGLSWDEHLPTDSAIIFHLFCTYLDSQLRPLPQPGGRPFYNRYVVVGDKKSSKETLAEVSGKNKAKCAILCTNPMKPKLNFVSDDKIHSCAYDRNNLFYVIIQFLIYMKTHHESSLEGINLGRSGINILCCIED